MIKTKATAVGKPGTNYPPGATLTGTERTRVGGEIPPTAPLPTMNDQHPHLTAEPARQTSAFSASLPLQGYQDVQFSGELGKAA